MSRLAEAAIAEAIKAERNRLWREENRAANAAYAEELAPRRPAPRSVSHVLSLGATWRSSTCFA